MGPWNRIVADRNSAIAAVFMIAALGIASHAAAQPCTHESVSRLPGKWSKGPADLAMANDAAAPGLRPAILKRIEPMAAMFREAYPEPRGTAASGHASIRRFGREFEVGPAQYGYTSLYKSWLCPSPTRRAELAEETGNWAYVHVNSLHRVLREFGEMRVDGRPAKVWRLARRIGDLRGETLYETWMGISHGRGLVFTRAGRQPWKTISQKQYLDALALYFEKQAGATNTAIDDVFRDMEKAIEDVRNNPNLKKEMRDQIVAQMEQEVARARTKRPGDSRKMAKGVADELKQIRDYQSNHSEKEMSQPAILPNGLTLAFRGQFISTESDGGHHLVVVDPAYFRKDLPQDASQIVTLLWRSEGDSPASAAWRSTFERRFPIERLRAMVDR